MRKELNEMADLLESKDSEKEFDELVERARYTAEFSAVSETAYDVREDLMDALREVR